MKKYLISSEHLFQIMIANHDVKCVLADRFQLNNLYDWFDETVITSIGSDRLISVIMPIQCKYGIDLESCARYQYEPLCPGDTMVVVSKTFYDCDTVDTPYHLMFKYSGMVYELALFNVLSCNN